MTLLNSWVGRICPTVTRFCEESIPRDPPGSSPDTPLRQIRSEAYAPYDQTIVRLSSHVNSSILGPLVLEGHVVGVGRLAFSSDGRTLASAAADRSIRLWNVATGNAR